MGTFVKVFSTLSSLEIHQLLHKQTCLVSSHSNQRPTMNKSVMFAVVAILAQFAASESDKDWCCKVAMVHHNIPKQTWGLLEPWGVYRGDEGLRKEWGNKECDDLVANSWNNGRNTNRCPICNNCVRETKQGSGSSANAVDWCCAALDVYKGKDKGGFNTLDIIHSNKYKSDGTLETHPTKAAWINKQCSSKVSECKAWKLDYSSVPKHFKAIRSS